MSYPYDSQWQVVRVQVLDRDGYECQIRLDGCTVRAEHVDHIVPLSEQGARLDPDNLRASCELCNLRRNRLRQADLARHALSAVVSDPSPSRRW